jgi:hypothetical protein
MQDWLPTQLRQWPPFSRFIPSALQEKESKKEALF